MQLTIQGTAYDVPNLTTLKILPFLAAMGIDYDLLISSPSAIAASREDMGRSVMIALADPTNHYRLAFSLSQLIPAIDPAIASFRSIERSDGSREQEISLSLDIQDLLGILNQISEQFMAQAQAQARASAARHEAAMALGPYPDGNGPGPLFVVR